MCACMGVSVHRCMCVCTSVCAQVHVCACVPGCIVCARIVCVHTWVCGYVCMGALCVHGCMCVCTAVCACVCGFGMIKTFREEADSAVAMVDCTKR